MLYCFWIPRRPRVETAQSLIYILWPALTVSARVLGLVPVLVPVPVRVLAPVRVPEPGQVRGRLDLHNR